MNLRRQSVGTTDNAIVSSGDNRIAGANRKNSSSNSRLMPNSKGNSAVSVVILTKNSAQTIQKCLEAVLRERPKEIIAVDAQSTDGTIKILRRYGVKILTDTQRSIAGSRQLGVNAASGDYVMFVDSDVVLTADSINTMLRELTINDWAG